MTTKVQDITEILLQDEEKLSPFAKKSSESAGRRFPLKPDPFRLEFMRDETRILHSPPFRRLKHKTQVFLIPDNDHICTRMEHVLHVSSIASVIGRCLNLNTDLINAIAMGHDLGHPAFGHAGERKLDIILTDLGIPGGFKHEIHGLRVVDRLTNYGDGLNLTYEVRDGIITHCGETFERVVQPNRNRNLHDLESITERNCYPSTLEGCLVRMIDRVAYLGRDLEDGMKAGLIEKADIPQPVANDLGTDNGKIIGRFVNDVITNSIGQDRIAMSSETFELMKLLKSFNYKRIYLHPATERRGAKSGKILEQLFFELSSIIEQSERGTAVQFCTGLVREAPLLQVLFHFMKNSNYTDDTPVWRIVTDYIAGMTDTFAQRTYASLFLPTPVV